MPVLAAAARCLRAPLQELATTLALTTALSVALGLLFPVHRAFDLAATTHGAYRLTSDIEIRAGEVDQLRGGLPPGSFMVALPWQTGLRAGGSTEEISAYVYMTASPENADLGYFAPGSVVAEAPVAADAAWIDLSASTARALRAHVGDEVTLGVGEQRTAYVVRRIHAVRLPAAPYLAQAPVGPVLASPERRGSDLQSLLWLRDLSPAETRALLARPFYASRLEKGGYPGGRVHIRTREAHGRTLAEQSSTSLGLIRAVSLLAILASVGFVLWEAWRLREQSRAISRVLVSLGGAPAPSSPAWRPWPPSRRA